MKRRSLLFRVALLLSVLRVAHAPLTLAEEAAPQPAVVDKDDLKLMQNLRSLGQALMKYLDANNMVWPQQPERLDEKARQDWWVNVLKPYGGERQHWIDPSDKAGAVAVIPTTFDSFPTTAYRWKTPWLVAKCAATGHTFSILPDGTIAEVKTSANSVHQQKSP